MVKSKTYIGLNGLTFIQDSELAFATVYLVKREGTEYDPFQAGMDINRTRIHDVSSGKVSFPIAFAGAAGYEKVYVLYKPFSSGPPTPPPGVCVPGAIVPITLPGAVVGQLYNHTITLTGTAPFTLSAVTVPAWLSISTAGNTVTLTGTPSGGDETTATLIEFTVNNCVANTALFSQSISVSAATANLFISNLSSPTVSINNVIDIPYVILTGAYPITYYSGITAIHSAYTGLIGVLIAGLVFPQTLTLQKNSVILETLFPSVDGMYTFGLQSYLVTDEIVIILN